MLLKFHSTFLAQAIKPPLTILLLLVNREKLWRILEEIEEYSCFFFL